MTNNNDSITRNNLQLVLLNSLKQHTDNPAFFFEDTYFSYQQVLERVSELQTLFLNEEPRLKSIGIIANNDLDTYSAIITCLLSGITYIPVEPAHPDDRNNYITELSALSSIFCSNRTTLSEGYYERNYLKFLPELKQRDEVKEPVVVRSNLPAYVLFTSGTTGSPKGVPITVQNLEAFVYNIDKMGVKVTGANRFLQVFDLTFDSSVFSYLIPLLHGACIYTLPKVPIKYTHAVQLIEDKDITHVMTVPSFINYLEPYFKEINLPSVKYWVFCGEALKSKNLAGWQRCVPNAEIFNGYGPTETTIICSGYPCKTNAIKARNGVVCIGKPFEGTYFALFNENNYIAANGIIGELCIAGGQLTAGYLNQDIKNKQAFFEYNGLTYYRTGDLCSLDLDSDYFFEGRNDSQIKIDGYRIELGEIENTAVKIEGISEAVAIVANKPGSVEIILFLVSEVQYSNTIIRDYLKKKIPDYMMPRKCIFIGNMPLNLNGKIDKKSLLAIYEQNV
jgi:amino acid adenylation domain-containing protein